MYDESPQIPSLALVFFLALLTSVCYVLSARVCVNPIYRDLWGFVGLVTFAAALYLGGIHALYNGANLYSRWRWPLIRTLEIIRGMSDNQIAYAKSAGLVRGKIVTNPGEIDWVYDTPFGDLDPDWVVSHLNGIAFSTFPEFPAIRRLSEGSVDYKNEMIFNQWMCQLNLAEKRPGQRFLWNKNATDVINALGLADENDDPRMPARHPKRVHKPRKMVGG